MVAGLEPCGPDRADATEAAAPANRRPALDFRVAQLIPRLGDGGVERCAADMARHLSERGIANWLVAADGRLTDEVRAGGTTVVSMAVGAKSPLAMLANARRLGQLIDDERIDIVHVLSRAPAWVALMARRWFASRPVRMIATVHGAHGHGSAVKRLYNSGMLRGELVVASSAFIRDHIRSVYDYPADRLILAPRGIDTARFDPARVSDGDRLATRHGFGVPDGTPLVILVGRITALKGHGVAIDALARLKDRDWRLMVVGAGRPDAEATLKRQAAELGIADRIVWTGSRADVADLIAAADLALSPSIRPEAFGLTAVEAEAMERPVVATDHGGSRETVRPGETGWLVRPGDPAAMAEAIAAALADPGRLAAMGRAGRAFVLSRFTRQLMLEREFSAYERVMTMAPGR